MGYLCAYGAYQAFSVWQNTFAIAGNGLTTDVFEAKFGWTEDETVIYNTIISSAGIVGLFIGSNVGGLIIHIGRRKTHIIAHLIAIGSCLISMIGTTWFLTIGRLLLGISAGITNIVFGKMITENMPQK